MPYVYLLQPSELVGTNIFKIGMSSLSDLSRVRSYGKGTEYLFIAQSDNYLELERRLIAEFRQYYTLARGHEYFEAVDKTEMTNRFIAIVAEHKKESVTKESLTASWATRFAFKAKWLHLIHWTGLGSINYCVDDIHHVLERDEIILLVAKSQFAKADRDIFSS